MTEQSDNNPFGEARATTAVMLRMEADGELPGRWRDDLRRIIDADPTAEDRIAFEHALRFRVSRVLADEAPAGLAERIRASLAALDQANESAEGSQKQPRPASAAPLRIRSLSGRLTRYALAAMLTLLVGVSAYLAWQVGQRPAVVGPGADVLLTQASTRIFDFVEAQARSCGDFQQYFQQKMTVREVERVSREFSTHLGARSAAPDLSAGGYTFQGAGTCGIPFYGPSVHYVYSRSTPSDGAALSIFVQRGTPPKDVREGVLYEITREGAATRVLLWREKQTLYYLVPPPGVEADAVLRHLATPSERKLLSA